MAVVNCWRIYEDIRSSPSLKDNLLGGTNQRSLFVKIAERAVENEQLMIDSNYCYKGHNLKELIARRFFNCVGKNLAKELTAATLLSIDQPSKKRKIAKLTGKLQTS